MMAKKLNVELINISDYYFKIESNDSQKEDILKLRIDRTYFLIEEQNMQEIWAIFKDAQNK